MRFSLKSVIVRTSAIAVLLVITYHLYSLQSTQPFPQRFSFTLPGHGRPGFPFPDGPKTPSDERAVAVIDTFRFAWNGYALHCFGHDELLPITGKCSNSRNGWGASTVDALSTALVMGQADIAEDILNYIPRINFKRNGSWLQTVNLFETTIRYLGGLIASYDLLKNGLNEDFSFDDWHIDGLLKQAKTLADGLSYAFNTPSGIPHNQLWLELNTHTMKQGTNSLAAAGSLVLEWQHLSDLTNDVSYQEKVQRVESYILNPSPETDLHSGLLGTWLNIDTGEFEDTWGSWGAGRDSAYEYMIKMFAYDPSRFEIYGRRWKEAAESTMEHFASRPMDSSNITFLADWRGQTGFPQSDALAGFAGGNFIFGGSVLGVQKYIDFGLELLNGYRHLQQSTVTGLYPETFSWNQAMVPETQTAFFDENGFWTKNPAYNTRPEVLESYYYAYRITNDTKYQDWTWELFQNINHTCRTEWGLSYVDNVDSKLPFGGKKANFQDSFVFSEIFKYSYLTFADNAQWQVQSSGENPFIFNTEGHPLRAIRYNEAV